MIPGVDIKTISFYKDSRGYMTELFRDDEKDMPRFAMGYCCITYPGIIRGPHEHIYQSDCFFFLEGCIELRLWDNRVGTPLETLEVFHFGIDNPRRVIIPPRVVHGYRNLSRYPVFILNYPDRLYKGYDRSSPVDEVRWEDGPDSPFKWPDIPNIAKSNDSHTGDSNAG
jgi:dTDP-4-dehydrorhamnose 3,5-epimerase